MLMLENRLNDIIDHSRILLGVEQHAFFLLGTTHEDGTGVDEGFVQFPRLTLFDLTEQTLD